MAAGSIVIDLLMKTGSFETDTKRAEKRLKEFKKSAQEWSAVTVTAATAVATAFAYLAKKSIDQLDALDEMSQSLGIAVEQLSSLANVAKIEGMALDDFGASMAKLTKVIGEAKAGSEEAGAVFKAMGLDPTAFKDSEDALLSIAEKMSGYQDGLEKTTLSQELFGKSGYKMIAFLNQGKDGINAVRGELDGFGLTTSEAAKQAGEFNDTLTKIGIIFDKIVEKIITDVLPTLKNLTEGFIDAAKASGSFMSATMSTIGKALFPADKDILKSQQQLLEDITENERKLTESKGGFLEGIYSAALAQKRADLAVLNQTINEVYATGETMSPLSAPASKTKAPIIPKTGTVKESEFDKAMNNLREQIALLGKETEYEKTLEMIQLGRYGKLTQGQEVSLKLAAEQLDIAKQNLKYNEEYTKFLDDITGRGDVEEFIKKMNMLSQALYDGTINAEKYQDAVSKLSMNFGDVTDEMGEFAKQAARNIQDTLGSSMEEILTGNFNNIGNAFTTMLNRMISQLAASQLNKLLFGQFDKSGELGGLAGAAVAGLTGLISGGPNNALGGDYGAFFAEGGYTGDGGNMEAAGIVHKGEYVLNASATRRIGIGALNRLNGYANGGYVGSTLPDSAGSGGVVNINIKNEAGGDGYQATATARKNDGGFDIDILVRKALSTDLKNNGQISQQFSNTFGLRRTM